MFKEFKDFALRGNVIDLAIGVIIGNNTTGTINMGVATPAIAAQVTIPAMSISQADATALKAVVGPKGALQRGPGSDNSVRWLLGEDSTAPGLTGALRDMYNPTCYGNPGKVSDPQYVCAFAGDNGGVHTNSGVPNHAYALTVDGGTYNGQTINGIGLTKAAHRPPVSNRTRWSGENSRRSPVACSGTARRR